MSVTPVARRPVLITVLVVLVVIAGVLAALAAFVLLTLPQVSVLTGIGQAVVAVAYFAVAKGLYDGNPTARSVAAVVAVIQLILAITALITVTELSGGAQTTSWTSIVFPVLVLVVLFTPKANAHFSGRR